MSHHRLDPKRTGVLFFDMLNAYYRGGDTATQQRMEPVVSNCVRIMKAARAVDIPIFYARADHRQDGADCATQFTDTEPNLNPWPDPTTAHHFVPVARHDTWHAEIINELMPEPEDYVILKHRWSAFYQTHLELSLRTRGIDTIVLAGGSTEVGIASTAYSARDMDFNLVIIRDACSSGHLDNHEQLMKRVFPRMARIRSADEVIEMMQPG